MPSKKGLIIMVVSAIAWTIATHGMHVPFWGTCLAGALVGAGIALTVKK